MLLNTKISLETTAAFPSPCRAFEEPLSSMLNDSSLAVWLGDILQQTWQIGNANDGKQALTLVTEQSEDTELQRLCALAALEACFAQYPDHATVRLCVPDDLANLLLRDSIALRTTVGTLEVAAERLWQQSDLWLASAGNNSQVQQHVMTDGRRHPRRSQKPMGTVYARHIPWLEQTLSFRVADVNHDLERFHRWMNDPRIAQFWQEDGDLTKHRDYLTGQLADPHIIPLIGCFDDIPFGYFEVYWAKENRIGAYYDANDYDRGWHVLIGEENVRGKAWITAWLPSLAHFMFLDDHRTQRIVGEPRADHHQQIRNLDKSGFAKIKEFDFPHKRAMLVMLLRERFFGDRLWAAHSA